MKTYKQGNFKFMGNISSFKSVRQNRAGVSSAQQGIALSYPHFHTCWVYDSCTFWPRLMAQKQQHNNVPGSSAPQVNVVYLRLSTAALALFNRPDSLGINLLTFPEYHSCHRTLNFIFPFLNVGKYLIELLLQLGAIAECQWWWYSTGSCHYTTYQIWKVHEKLKLLV